MEEDSFNTNCNVGPNALWEVPAKQICIQMGTIFLNNRHERCWYTYMPPTTSRYDDETEDETMGEGAPLVLDLHGFNGCPLYQSRKTGWKELAQEKNFVVVWPLGTVDGDRTLAPCWNAGTCCCFPTPKNTNRYYPIDDVEFLRQVIANVVESSSVPINTRRIYIAGHSNGCMMAQTLGVELRDVVAGIACHSGVRVLLRTKNIINDEPNNTDPTRTPKEEEVLRNNKDGGLFVSGESPDDLEVVPIMTIHGDQDKVVNYNGDIFLISSAQDNIATWANTNGCNMVKNLTVSLDDTYATHVYSGCDRQTSVELVQVFGVGHDPYQSRGSKNLDTTALAKEFVFRQVRTYPAILPPCSTCRTKTSDSKTIINPPAEEHDSHPSSSPSKTISITTNPPILSDIVAVGLRFDPQTSSAPCNTRRAFGSIAIVANLASITIFFLSSL
eukprot:CAMPEP_0198290582 /NCGR_PEP_ID=MMETSP1449-20131203/8387_1 /TAXON_ID=420275 /ORGANISM="Attheya septentrionalis, Strain CCMP2084" /LENGTH=442 /DNA_ID=CAMNT_0043989097 /DNA_START=185 /DNA_END=1513 /DNA_ORIENTATION=-